VPSTDLLDARPGARLRGRTALAPGCAGPARINRSHTTLLAQHTALTALTLLTLVTTVTQLTALTPLTREGSSLLTLLTAVTQHGLLDIYC
jgi:hypothetical protein